MHNALYRYKAADGNTYQGTIAELRQWANEGRVQLDEFVTDAITGRDSILRDLLFPVQLTGPTPFAGAVPVPAGAYPRGFQSVPTSLDTIGKFSWGAFFLTWIWGLNHRKPITLLVIPLSCIPLGGLICAIYFGTKGNEWAWESGRFATSDDCKACQTIWMRWGLGLFLAYLALIVLAIILSVLVPNQR